MHIQGQNERTNQSGKQNKQQQKEEKTKEFQSLGVQVLFYNGPMIIYVLFP